MSKTYKIKQSDSNKAILTVNPNTADLLGIRKKKTVILRFGSIRQFADINLCSDTADNEIQLSAKLIANLHLPEYPDYELRIGKNEMEIGPFIGMLMAREDKKLTPSFLEKMKIYLGEYGKLHGAVAVFALDKVDTAGRLIEGYCYNPASGSFEKGVFPFPASIYRTIGLGDFWKNCFLTVLGDRVFNSRYFNKWDMYQWYSKHPYLSSHVPFTCKFQTIEDVFDPLEKYRKVFIKPISGLGGRGVAQVRLNGGKYEIRYRENGENLCQTIESKEDAAEYIKTKFSGCGYLVQQPVELIQIKGRVVDFRCVMQKDQSGKWICQAIIGRSGDRESIVSNISSGGTAFSIGDLALGSIPLFWRNSYRLSNEIRALALQICGVLDDCGINCGTLGLDIGADIRGKLWLIEINNRDPDPTIALDINDRSLYERLKTGILYYAKFLSGFGSSGGSSGDSAIGSAG